MKNDEELRNNNKSETNESGLLKDAINLITFTAVTIGKIMIKYTIGFIIGFLLGLFISFID